ncbi:Carbamate kinase [Sulfidibacter corallicola]|uniref:Carbamate kinase n=1 Tax=Sulfidibacter corallicola TaxID=2818388 RepID=A0A8A4TEK0_SULCO|nr:carbamate kinase [Sulfidibacter corallicola]QTD48053.1 carbamate kinase [Sulfidibacter corallicola]
MKKALIAFGGNALVKAGEIGLQKQQLDNAKEAAEMVVRLLEQGYLPIIVHGNGPQVGNVLIQQEEAANRVPPYTMDICVAQTVGSMGYMLQRSIENMIRFKGLSQKVSTVLSEVVVDAEDPGFHDPTKPVGPFYENFRAHQLESEKGWVMKEDSGRGWRRQVPSPQPLRIAQIDAIRSLVDAGFVVLACGGGGIPVYEDPNGYLIGIEAVVDKDRTSAMLGHELEAEVFIVLTGVEKVALDFGKPTQRDLDRMTVSEAARYLEEGQFPPGSMGPKIQSSIEYIRGGGREVLITTAECLLRGQVENVGTRIVPDP